MIYNENLVVAPFIADDLELIIEKSNSSVKQNGTEFDEEVVFENKYFMVIQVCADDGDCYSQGVLYDNKRNELDCTQPQYFFVGEYVIEFGDDTYIVNVNVA